VLGCAIDWLNYHHLHYFWIVAREGSITKASQVLRLAHPTISSQIHRLEKVLGATLFVRKGRNLVLTETGRIVARQAEEIFALGQQLVDIVHGRTTGQMRLVVGVSDVLAKSIVHRILEPAFRMQDRLHVICRQDRTVDAFMGELAAHTVDVVLSNAPAAPDAAVKTFSHRLGECGTSWLAAPGLARRYRRGFPRSLDGAPLLLPSSESLFRRALDRWFVSQEIHPLVIAELDDSALVNVLGEKGLGVFAAPDVIEDELRQRHRVQVVGRTPRIQQQFFAISIERKIKHPGVAAICEIAREQLFD
jgi:LysR family transcriptional regulator, transcriptional activator of nhaA